VQFLDLFSRVAKRHAQVVYRDGPELVSGGFMALGKGSDGDDAKDAMLKETDESTISEEMGDGARLGGLPFQAKTSFQWRRGW
jgi:hypothetical protein